MAVIRYTFLSLACMLLGLSLLSPAAAHAEPAPRPTLTPVPGEPQPPAPDGNTGGGEYVAPTPTPVVGWSANVTPMGPVRARTVPTRDLTPVVSGSSAAIATISAHPAASMALVALVAGLNALMIVGAVRRYRLHARR